jgi:hypothetical protein
LALNVIRFFSVILLIVELFARSATFCAAQQAPPRELDVRRLAAAGLRVIDGRRLRLVTDLPPSAAVDELPAVFDAALPQWAAYFKLPAEVIKGRWLAFLIQDRQKFAALDLLPNDNPNFPTGYSRGYELWLMEQPSDYYRRHLFLHEGTHSFMYTQLGGAGPGWYMEGMAELLGTHRWENGRLQLGVFPQRKDDVPMWGRIKLIRDAVAEGKALPIEAVMKIDNRRKLSTGEYAWTWALAALLDGHPRFQSRFRELKKSVADPAFDERFRASFAEDWDDLLIEWDAFVATIDYGYDMPRMAMIHKPARDVGSQPQTAKIAADRGWQSTGWLLKARQAYRVSASGRFQIADDGRPWPCEPGGVTIEYHDGKPLGMLLGALRPTATKGRFGSPTMIGLQAMIEPKEDAVLYLRVNDSPAKLNDNRGELNAKIEPVASHLAPGQ